MGAVRGLGVWALGVLGVGGLAGCTHLGGAAGAVPIAPGTKTVGLSLELDRGVNPLSITTGLPLPGVGVQWRWGLEEDVDVGVNVHLFGSGADVRYRFAEAGAWQLAVNPGVELFVFPLPSLFGTADLRFPLRMEHPLGRTRSLTVSPEIVAHQSFFIPYQIGAAEPGSPLVSRSTGFQVLLGGGVRLGREGERLERGWSVTMYTDPMRGSGWYGGGGLDLAWRPR